MLSWKRIGRQRWVQVAAGTLAAEYLRFVYMTSRLVTEPTDIYERVVPDLPVIMAMWHGQHFMAPFVKRDEHRAKHNRCARQPSQDQSCAERDLERGAET